LNLKRGPSFYPIRIRQLQRCRHPLAPTATNQIQNAPATAPRGPAATGSFRPVSTFVSTYGGASMTRWLLALLAVAVSLGASADDHFVDANELVSRPNVLIILTDDQRWNLLDTMPTVRERIGNQGIRFTRALAQNPLCCPGRASLLTGQNSSTHGVWHNIAPEGGAPAFDDSETLATWFDAAGYRTAYVGKYLNRYDLLAPYVPPGWDEWHVLRGQGYFDPLMVRNGVEGVEEGYSTDILTDIAVGLIGQGAWPRGDAIASGATPDQAPFFLVYAPFAPHKPATPAPRHEGTCDALPVKLSPAFNEQDVSDKPLWIQSLSLKDEESVRALARDQLCSLKAVDEGVGRLLDALGDELDNTIVVFLSDNGFSLGDHRYLQKPCLYGSCLRIPLMIRYPPMIEPGSRNGSLVLNIDIAPTLLELAGVEAGEPDGLPLVPIFEGERRVRRQALVEMRSHDDPSLHDFGLRSRRWQYIELATGERELYDLREDRWEMLNVVADPQYAGKVARFSARMEAMR